MTAFPRSCRFLLAAAALVGIASLAAADDKPLYLNSQAPLEDRVSDLLGRLTLDEKISLIHGDSKFTTAAVPRLGIPRRWMSDGPHGVREDVGPDTWNAAGRTDDFSTFMPVNINLAATFNPDMATEYGAVIGQEARARGKHIMLGPGMNIMRTPLNGRNFEYLGEDPFLASRMVVNYIKGAQAQGIASCAKHFAANNQEVRRMNVNVEMDERTLREIYLPAFKAAVLEGNVLTVMGAYNQFRGEHCCHNDYLLNKVLKGQWNFQGLVMSDWAGTHDTRQAVFNGLDLEMGTEKPYDEFYLARPFREGIQKGDYPLSLLDDKVRRNLRVMFATHMFDPGPAGSLNTPAHQAAARRIAEEGIVLLKNDRALLPLDATKFTSIAVIGDLATRKTAAGGGSAGIKAFYEVTPLEGLVRRAGDRLNITYSQGYAPPAPRPRTPATQPAENNLIDRAVAAAKQADVAIVVAGLGHGRNMDEEGTDRRNMALPYNEDELIARVAAANPRTIVVIMSGGPVEMTQWLDQTPAVLQAWYPGIEGGNALARILFGDVNPSGKLPCTFPRQLDDSPAHALGAYPGENGVERYTEGLLVGYRWFDTKKIEPLFAFGHGLSYTRFEYGNLRLTPAADPKNATVATVECDVANVGPRDGAAVLQLYIHPAKPSLPRPEKELKAFRKVVLKQGEKQTVSIPLDRSAFAYFDPDKNGWLAEQGDYTILIGDSSRDIRQQADFKLKETTLDPRP